MFAVNVQSVLYHTVLECICECYSKKVVIYPASHRLNVNVILSNYRLFDFCCFSCVSPYTHRFKLLSFFSIYICPCFNPTGAILRCTFWDSGSDFLNLFLSFAEGMLSNECTFSCNCNLKL